MKNNDLLKYIGYYTLPNLRPSRSVSLAARNKMDYTVDVLSRVFKHIQIISPAVIQRGEKGCKSSNIKISENLTLHLFSMFTNRNRWVGYLNFVLVKLKLFCYLLINTHKGEPVLVYHSLMFARLVKFAHRIKKFKLILEVNEIYTDVSPKLKQRRNLEMSIIQDADAYLFPNNLMNGLFNKNGKPYAVEYGVYTPERKVSDPYDDGFIHVVYAGTFEPEKGGASAAIASAMYLPSNYHLHILGFGSEDEILNIQKSINEVNSLSRCVVTYHGKLDGREFVEFIQKCHIGLSTQDPKADFNATSFPSKILTYLANGLQVVSIAIPAISESNLREDIFFYVEQTPEAIAQAILNVKDFTAHFNILNSLDQNLEKDLSQLMALI